MLCKRLKHAGVVCLTLWYFGVSTNVIYSVFDSIIPQVKTVASLDFPCASHNCGCQTAEKCRSHCCCFPVAAQSVVESHCKAEPKQENPITIKVSSFSAAHCDGQSAEDQSLAGQGVAPHLLSSPISIAMHLKPANGFLVNDLTPASVYAGLPDKVPI